METSVARGIISYYKRTLQYIERKQGIEEENSSYAMPDVGGFGVQKGKWGAIEVDGTINRLTVLEDKIIREGNVKRSEGVVVGAADV